MSIVDQARDAADRLLLTDECTVTREGDPVFDPDTGQYVTPTVTVGEGLACNARPVVGARRGMDVVFGGETVSVNTYQVAFRYDAPEIRPEDKITFTVSRDGWLVGRQFRVDAVRGESFQTARRVLAEWVDTSIEEESGGSSS